MINRQKNTILLTKENDNIVVSKLMLVGLIDSCLGKFWKKQATIFLINDVSFFS